MEYNRHTMQSYRIAITSIALTIYDLHCTWQQRNEVYLIKKHFFTRVFGFLHRPESPSCSVLGWTMHFSKQFVFLTSIVSCETCCLKICFNNYQCDLKCLTKDKMLT